MGKTETNTYVYMQIIVYIMQYFQHHAQYVDVTHSSLTTILLLSAIYMPLKANLKDSFTEFRSVTFVIIDCLKCS